MVETENKIKEGTYLIKYIVDSKDECVEYNKERYLSTQSWYKKDNRDANSCYAYISSQKDQAVHWTIRDTQKGFQLWTWNNGIGQTLHSVDYYPNTDHRTDNSFFVSVHKDSENIYSFWEIKKSDLGYKIFQKQIENAEFKHSGYLSAKAQLENDTRDEISTYCHVNQNDENGSTWELIWLK